MNKSLLALMACLSFINAPNQALAARDIRQKPATEQGANPSSRASGQSTSADDGAKDTVAVMDFTAINAPGSEASVLSEFVRSAVIQSGVFTVVDKKNMDKVLSEQAFQQTGCTSDECAVKLGKVLNVRKMIMGSYSIMGQTRFLTARLVDVETGKIDASAKEKGFTPEDADTAAEHLVTRLIGGTPVESESAPAYQEPDVDEGLSLKRVRNRRLASTAETVRPPRPASDMKGYLQVFYGRGTASLKGIRREALRVYGTVPIWKEKMAGEVEMVQEMAPIGVRIGGWGNIFGVDGEFSTEKYASKAATRHVDVTTFDSVNYGFFGYDAILGKGWIVEQPVNFGMNLYLHGPSKWVVQPYVGLGLGMTFDLVSSRTARAPNMEYLSELGIAGTVKFPFGVRLRLGETFFVYGEYQPGFRFGTYSTTNFDPNYRRTYQIDFTTMSGGVGFTF